MVHLRWLWLRFLDLLLLVSHIITLFTIIHVVYAAVERQVHYGWKACRLTGQYQNHPALGCSTAVWNVTQLPTTALAVLLENNAIFFPQQDTTTMNDLYKSNIMAQLPDISDTGRDYYTLVYQQDNLTTLLSSCNDDDDDDHPSTFLQFAGIHYRVAAAYLDGRGILEVPTLRSSSSSSSSSRNNHHHHHHPDGMFRRRLYDVTCGRRFHVIVEPPLHPGTCRRRTTSKSDDNCVGQGGNHALAQDGATAQYMLGWDWVRLLDVRLIVSGDLCVCVRACACACA